jgi:hypothetical protein
MPYQEFGWNHRLMVLGAQWNRHHPVNFDLPAFPRVVRVVLVPKPDQTVPRRR